MCAVDVTDDIIGYMMYKLKSNQLYTNTLIVFTSVNDGNKRVIAVLSGGEQQKDCLIPDQRDDRFSNWDWTLILLDFAGYLDCIDHAEYMQEGMGQYAMVIATNNFTATMVDVLRMRINTSNPLRLSLITNPNCLDSSTSTLRRRNRSIRRPQ